MPTWRAPGEHVEKGVVPPPTANQGCSSAQWVPMEELEGEYDHSFGHRGVTLAPITSTIGRNVTRCSKMSGT